jgi:effector-binding domain-containing protein
VTGVDGACYSEAFFETHDGEVVAFVPTSGTGSPVGRVQPLELPAGRYAVTVHEGPFAEIDRAYAALGTFVTERAIGAPGPLREHYVVTAADTSDPAELRTEVCWPIQPRD